MKDATTPEPEIVARIRKLLALAGNNPSREEAEAAMMKAQTLLAAHGLALRDLEAEEPSVRERQVPGSNRRTPWWHSEIAKVVAMNFRCSVYLRWAGRFRRLVLVGRTGDLEVAEAVFDLARATAEYEAKRYLATAKRNRLGWSRTLSTALRNDFLGGFVRGLGESFRKNVEATGSEIMVVQPVEVTEYLDALSLKTITSSSHVIRNCVEARGEGYAAGRRFSHKDRLGDASEG